MECEYELAANEVDVAEEHWDDHDQPDVLDGQLVLHDILFSG